MSITHLTDQNAASFLTGHPLVIVKFYANWCGPCQMTAPIFHDLVASDFATKNPDLAWAELDIDEAMNTAADHGVMSIPTFIVFKNGEEIDRHIGGLDEATLKKFVESNL